jgi:hypothetical protein
MSHAQSTASSSPKGTNFQLIINNALDKYKKRTKNDLLAHPLAAQLQSCDSPAAILAILHQQVQGSDQSRSSDEQWSRWLDPTINVLYALSSTLGTGVGLVCLRVELVWDLHAYTYLAGIFASDRDIFRDRCPPFSAYPSYRLRVGHFNAYTHQAAKDARASQDILIDIVERVEMFIRRLEIYIEVRPTPEMMDTIIQIMVEVLSILGIATKEINQGRISKYLPCKYENVD